VKVAVHRLRRRYRDVLYDEIAQTVSTPEEVELELQYLMESVKM
jgi:RNA polymerase sigma-70 factor (ECF subfamily)